MDASQWVGLIAGALGLVLAAVWLAVRFPFWRRASAWFGPLIALGGAGVILRNLEHAPLTAFFGGVQVLVGLYFLHYAWATSRPYEERKARRESR
jgi:hypothetical protein